MDHDTTGDAGLDDNGLDVNNDHDAELAEDSPDLGEPDLPEEDSPLSVPGPEVAAVKAPRPGSGPTVMERMRSAGINEARALEHLQKGWVRLDGQVITDPDHPAAPPARWVILP